MRGEIPAIAEVIARHLSLTFRVCYMNPLPSSSFSNVKGCYYVKLLLSGLINPEANTMEFAFNFY